MVDCSAAGVVSAGSNTGVGTLLLDTRLVAWALGVEDTLRTAVGSGSYVAPETGTRLVPIDFSAESIGATWVRDTGDVRGRRWRLVGILVAVEEWVAAVAAWTAADGVVVDNFALGVGTAGARARVDTLLLDTCLAQLALRGEQALRATVGRASEVARQAGADSAGNSRGQLRPALTVGSTRVWVAGVPVRFSDRRFSFYTLAEGIPSEPSVTCAGCDVVDNLAPCVYTAGAWTRVYALQIRACSVSRAVGVRDALWAAAGVGVAEVTLDAGATCSSSEILALCVCSTWTRQAGIHRSRSRGIYNLRDFVALPEGVTIVARWTLADCQVISD